MIPILWNPGTRGNLIWLVLILFLLSANPAQAYLPEDMGFIAPVEKLDGHKVPLKEGWSASTARHRLRSNSRVVASGDRYKVFGLDKNRRPLKYIDNDYVDNHDGTVTDRATGLTWQQSGSKKTMNYADAEKYVARLNRARFAGYNDWHLPTVPELMSLTEPKEMNGDLYIDPVFDNKQRWCWSADGELRGGAAWHVLFNFGEVHWRHLGPGYCVRAVRP